MKLANTQASVNYSNETFKEYIFKLATGIIWKNEQEAQATEPTDTNELYRIELFIAANRGLLNYDIIRAFPREALEMVGGVSSANLDIYAADKSKIPLEIRDACVQKYAELLTKKNLVTGHYTFYKETNNYYRKLMGLPNLNDVDKIYNTDPRWDMTTPIPEMKYVERIEMEQQGVLQQIQAQYPEKEYLKFCGKRMIDFFNARTAEKYSILWRDETNSDVLNKAFDECYESCRYAMINVYFTTAYRNTNALYDNFIAMAIVFMTINIMQSKYLTTDITRDFYDIESLKVIYDSYSVPFYSEIPLEYHRKIVKAMNNLINKKGSDIVFNELFGIFDLGSMTINNYLLTKRHKMDLNNRPQFNPMRDPITGDIIYDDKGRPKLDPEKDYEYAFSKVPVGDDASLAVSDKANDVDYETITVPDPYWIEDNDLKEKLMNASFNFKETKYMGVQIVFDLIRISLESAYVFRMLTDNFDVTTRMTFYWSEIGSNCSFFDLFIYLSAIYCRMYGFEGTLSAKIDDIGYYMGYDIQHDAEYISKVILGLPSDHRNVGYNFEQNMELYEKVLNDPYLSQNTELVNLMMGMSYSNWDGSSRPSPFNSKMYENIQTIRDLVADGYINAKTKKEFEAYRELYNALMISKAVEETYRNPYTGEIFETYTDILAVYNPRLLQRYILLEDEDIESEMTIIIDKVEEMITSLRYLPFSAGANSSMMIQSLFKILKFFKSVKAELIGYDIIYVIRMRGLNFFKMIDLIYGLTTESYFDEGAEQLYLDIAELMDMYLKLSSDRFRINDKLLHESIFAELSHDIIISLRDVIHQILEEYHLSEELLMFDLITDLEEEYGTTQDLIQLKDSWYTKNQMTYMNSRDSHMTLSDKMSADEITGCLDTVWNLFSKLISSDQEVGLNRNTMYTDTIEYDLIDRIENKAKMYIKADYKPNEDRLYEVTPDGLIRVS